MNPKVALALVSGFMGWLAITMIPAGLGFMVVPSIIGIPAIDSAPWTLGWIFEHHRWVGSIQVSVGLALLLITFGLLRRLAWGRNAARAALGVLFVTYLVFGWIMFQADLAAFPATTAVLFRLVGSATCAGLALTCAIGVWMLSLRKVFALDEAKCRCAGEDEGRTKTGC